MLVSRWRWLTSGIVLLGTGAGPGLPDAWAQSGAERPPALEGPAPAPESGGLLHEAFQTPGPFVGRVRVPKAPPPPLEEQPTADRPDARAQWVAGYWTWDPARADFVWVPGAWRVPPPGAIWVGGRWMRDADGWYRVPGFWSRRQDNRGANAVAAGPTSRAGWRTTGPPAEHPDDTPGPAPGPDYFYVPGQYTPDGDHLTWSPGFWGRAQPGWDWVPARWVRRPDGWEFRPGYWSRDPEAAGTDRPDVAPGLPPAVVESEPAGSNADASRPPTPRAGADAGRDPIAEGESGARAMPAPGNASPMIVVPCGVPFAAPYPPIGTINGVPFRVIRPPGYYPYGPAGVMVPAAVPPFVQRILDRVLP